MRRVATAFIGEVSYEVDGDLLSSTETSMYEISEKYGDTWENIDMLDETGENGKWHATETVAMDTLNRESIVMLARNGKLRGTTLNDATKEAIDKANDHGARFVVGDMSQAIYSFRGANFRNILNFQKDYPQAQVYPLERNYRSTPQILDAATNIISNNSTHIVLNLKSHNGKSGNLVNLFEARDEEDEAQFIIKKLTTKMQFQITKRQLN